MELRFNLIIRAENFNLGTWKDFLHFKSTLIQPTRFGDTEPLKNKIVDTEEAVNAVLSLHKKDLGIMFEGKKKFWLYASTYSMGLLRCSGGMDIKEKELAKLHELIDFIHLFARNRQLLYGCLCPEQEYDIRHKVVRKYSYGWKGFSMWDFMDYLPGLHWYTIAGRDLVEAIGVNKFKNLQGVNYTLDNEEAIAFHLNSDIREVEDNIHKLIQLEDQIGAHYFFGKEKVKGTYSHPESYKKFLRSFVDDE